MPPTVIITLALSTPLVILLILGCVSLNSINAVSLETIGESAFFRLLFLILNYQILPHFCFSIQIAGTCPRSLCPPSWQCQRMHSLVRLIFLIAKYETEINYSFTVCYKLSSVELPFATFVDSRAFQSDSF